MRKLEVMGGGVMRCYICQKENELKFLPLYVYGSEGINLCHDCEMSLINIIRDMARIATVSRKLGYQLCKEVAKAKSHNPETKGKE